MIDSLGMGFTTVSWLAHPACLFAGDLLTSGCICDSADWVRQLCAGFDRQGSTPPIHLEQRQRLPTHVIAVVRSLAWRLQMSGIEFFTG
jgi:hypothetical protein